jgi:hypothetical protein
MMNINAIAERIVIDLLASRGNYTRRKDKDLISDSGGVSKGRDREPALKPPRDDVKKRYRTKDKPSDIRDLDTDKSLDARRD